MSLSRPFDQLAELSDGVDRFRRKTIKTVLRSLAVVAHGLAALDHAGPVRPAGLPDVEAEAGLGQAVVAGAGVVVVAVPPSHALLLDFAHRFAFVNHTGVVQTVWVVPALALGPIRPAGVLGARVVVVAPALAIHDIAPALLGVLDLYLTEVHVLTDAGRVLAPLLPEVVLVIGAGVLVVAGDAVAGVEVAVLVGRTLLRLARWRDVRAPRDRLVLAPAHIVRGCGELTRIRRARVAVITL